MSTNGKTHPPIYLGAIRSGRRPIASTFPGISGKILGALAAFLALAGALEAAPAFRRLPLAEYRDRMQGGWIGQMAGVAWGGPTEFRYQGRIIPERELPCWVPQMINDSFEQDDLYVEMTFLRTLEERGLEVSAREAGIDWARTGYPLWHANEAARKNLRQGIAPPDSGHPRFNPHADDIDYQLEADFSGLVAPGLPRTALALGEKFGRLMNYGDGLYGGQFVGGMYASAFFEEDPERIVEAGLRCIPESSRYSETIRNVMQWWREEPEIFEKTWAKIEAKYQRDPSNRKFSCGGGEFDIDAKLNGAYVVLGLLYGRRDPDRTITIACRAGQDSDCNPSSAAGVLFTSIGFSRLPKQFVEKLDAKRTWLHTAYDFPKLIEACEKVAREAVVKAGGHVEKDPQGGETLVIPIDEPKPEAHEECWDPAPPSGSRFTDVEMARIRDPR
jgi:hypothetical protein